MRSFISVLIRVHLRSSAVKASISGFNLPDSFINGNNRLSGSNIAERNGTGLFNGPVITPHRTPRISSNHNANSGALPIVADNNNNRMRGGVKIMASSQT
jgi:hypothetical protein